MPSFTDEIIKYHGDILLNRELPYAERERLADILEDMTNIDTPEKIIVFADLVSMYPKLDYNKIANELQR